MVSLQWIAGIIVILIGLGLLIWAFIDVVQGAGVDVEFLVKIIVGIILVIVGAALAKGGKISITE